jgi:hypothetical protein
MFEMRDGMLDTRHHTTALQVGQAVEVEVGLTGGWSHGFEVASVNQGRFWLRGVSDGSTLPISFTGDRLRSA